MLIVVAVALCWLALAALVTLLCRMAAQGDEAPARDLPESAGAGIEELLIWEALAHPTLHDARPATPARSASQAQDTMFAASP